MVWGTADVVCYGARRGEIHERGWEVCKVCAWDAMCVGGVKGVSHRWYMYEGNLCHVLKCGRAVCVVCG